MAQCSDCKFWTPWREVLLGDDAPRFIGHCVVRVPVTAGFHKVRVQGLTGDDFWCAHYREASKEQLELPPLADESATYTRTSNDEDLKAGRYTLKRNGI